MGGHGEWLKARFIERSTSLLWRNIDVSAWTFYAKTLYKNVDARDIFYVHIYIYRSFAATATRNSENKVFQEISWNVLND